MKNLLKKNYNWIFVKKNRKTTPVDEFFNNIRPLIKKCYKKKVLSALWISWIPGDQGGIGHSGKKSKLIDYFSPS